MNNKRKKPMSITIMCFVFAVVFIFAGLGLAIFIVYDDINSSRIIKNGVEIEGTVKEYYKGSSTTYENETIQYYYVTYEYELDGETKTGKTGSHYLLEEVQNMTTIKLYLYKGKVVEADALDSADWYIAFVGIPFIGFGVFVMCLGIKFLNDYKEYKNGLKDGTFTKAVFVRKFSNTRINRAPQYRIVCKYTKSTGEVVEGEARGLFNSVEAKYLQLKGEINISYNDKSFVITEDLGQIDYDEIYRISDMTITSHKYDGTIDSNVSHFQCEQCSQIVKPTSDGHCPICGELIDRHQEKVEQENRIPCPSCGNNVLKTAKFCNRCGASMNQQSQVQNEVQQPQTINCPNCGKEVSSSANFCTGCGNKMK